MTVTFDEFEGEGGNIFEIIDIIQLKQCVIASIERWMTNSRRAEWIAVVMILVTFRMCVKQGRSEWVKILCNPSIFIRKFNYS